MTPARRLAALGASLTAANTAPVAARHQSQRSWLARLCSHLFAS
jgi:hypothetical protein